MLSDQGERALVKLLTLFSLVAFFLFIICGYYSVREFRFALSGRTADATITNLDHARAVGPFAMKITYQFTDPDDGLRTESHVFEHGLAIAIQGGFNVTYLPKVPNSSIPTSERKRWAIPVFITMLLFLIASLTFITRSILKGLRAMDQPLPKDPRIPLPQRRY